MFNGYKKFLDIFYHSNKRDFLFCDCYGICHLFNKEVLGVELPEFLNEKIYTDDDVYSTLQVKKESFKSVSNGKECEGDIVILNIKGYPVHVGVVLQNGNMLHIMREKHAEIESYKNSKWKNRVDSFWSYESLN